MKKYLSIILNLLIIIFGFLGIYFSIFSNGFMNQDAFLYYTIQSNLFVIFTAFITLFFELRDFSKNSIPNVIYSLRFISTVDITLTFVVFSLMLTPTFIIQNNTEYLISPSNLFVHNLLPLAAIFDWCFFGNSIKLKKRHTLYALIFPFVYCVFMLIRSFLGLTVEGNHVPYFFLDYKKYSWFLISKNGLGVIYWILILTFALLGICMFFKKICLKRK